MPFRKQFSQIKLGIPIFIIIILISSLALYVSNSKIAIENYPEINYLKEKNLDFNQLKIYFTNLSREKTPAYAFEVLKKAPVSFGVNVHLLAHAIGDELYNKEGINGLKICTADIQYACFHSIITNLFYEKGDNALHIIREACKNAPGGHQEYNMCYHGLGHGVLAYYNYDLDKAVDICKKTGTREFNNQEYRECIGGAVMEQIGGGDHDKDTWALKRVKYLNKNDPLSICMGPLMEEESRKICLIYITPFLWEAGGRNSSIPSSEVQKKAFSYCESIPLNQPHLRDGCFGGFGKEITDVIRGDDTRQNYKFTEDITKKIYHLCLLTLAPDGQKSCILYSLNKVFRSTGNDKSKAEYFCSGAPERQIRDYCYDGLKSLIN